MYDLLSTGVQELGRLREMQFLELSENRLESLPAEMGYLTELQDCYLSENLLTELPETFGREFWSYTCRLLYIYIYIYHDLISSSNMVMCEMGSGYMRVIL